MATSRRQQQRAAILQQLATLRTNGGEVGIRAGKLRTLTRPTPATIYALGELLKRERHVVEILRETRCQHCGSRLDDHEIGHEPICFSCWLGEAI